LLFRATISVCLFFVSFGPSRQAVESGKEKKDLDLSVGKTTEGGWVIKRVLEVVEKSQAAREREKKKISNEKKNIPLNFPSPLDVSGYFSSAFPVLSE
jgi:hypothetical protein